MSNKSINRSKSISRKNESTEVMTKINNNNINNNSDRNIFNSFIRKQIKNAKTKVLKENVKPITVFTPRFYAKLVHLIQPREKVVIIIIII